MPPRPSATCAGSLPSRSTPWSGIRECTAFSDSAAQVEVGFAPGTQERGQPLPQRPDPCQEDRRTLAGDGLVPRRRLQHRLGQPGAVLLAFPFPARRRPGEREPPTGADRPDGASCAFRGIAGRRLRQLHVPRPHRRLEVGADQHRCLRRRPRQRHDLRRVRRRRQDRRPGGLAAGERPLPSRHLRERRERRAPRRPPDAHPGGSRGAGRETGRRSSVCPQTTSRPSVPFPQTRS